MNDLERIDRVEALITEALNQLSSHNQRTLEVTPEGLAFEHLIDARDEVRTLRARFVSGAGSLTD